MSTSLFLLLFGFTALVKGADWFVEGACGIADRFGIPQLVIGLTIVAMGTSAPEAAVSIAAAIKESADITIGNIVGSNILNILIILGISSLITPIAISRTSIMYEIPFMMAVTLLLLILGMDGFVSFIDGWLLLLVFLLYLCYLFIRTRRDGDFEAAAKRKHDLWQSVFWTATGLVSIIVGSNTAVDAAVDIARTLGMSERFIGLTIIALGTSLPELFTSVSAARKGNADIAIGNIIGSNIFNILFVVGISALLIPVPFSERFYLDTGIAVSASVPLLLGGIRRRQINRMSGIVMLTGYMLYFIMLCC